MATDTSLVILAAGEGKRLGRGNKALLPLGGEALLSHSLRTGRNAPSIAEIVVVMNPADVDALQELWGCTPQDLGATTVVSGGTERWLSSQAGCMSTQSELRYVLVHDAARALIEPSDIERILDAARNDGCAIAAAPLADTLKREDENSAVLETVPRENLWCAQTPQGGRRDWMLEAFAQWDSNSAAPTDEAMLFESIGHAPTLVPCSQRNFKITHPADFELAEHILRSNKEATREFKTGLGWDRHRMEPNRPCILGGLQLDCPVGPAGHSDADAVLHALTDAILGVAGLEDIGTLFPDTDPKWKDAPSTVFLEQALHLAQERGWQVQNADVVLVCDRPKIAPIRDEMRKKLSELLQISKSQIHLKGKTTEACDTQEKVEATAVVLMKNDSPKKP